MLLLKPLITHDICAECRFCCSFRRCSLWETPVLEPELLEKLKTAYPDAKFKKVEYNGHEAVTVDLDGRYNTDDSEEEALCWLNDGKGCPLGDDKPFDCAIWPLRVMKKDNAMVLAYCAECTALKEKDPEVIKKFVEQNGLDKKLIDYAKKYPAYIRDFHENYMVIKVLEGD